MLARAVRAALCDRKAYHGLGEDPAGGLHAMGTVAMAAIAIGLGMWSVAMQTRGISPGIVALLAMSTIALGWVTWTALAYLLGTWLLGGRASYRQLLRAIGVSYGPGVLLLLMAVPFARTAFFFVAALWVLVAGVVAVREVQGFSLLKAAVPTVAGWYVAFFILPSLVFQDLA